MGHPTSHQNSWDQLMMYHLIWDGLVLQTKYMKILSVYSTGRTKDITILSLFVVLEEQ